MAPMQKARLEAQLWTPPFHTPVVKEAAWGWAIFELLVDLPEILFHYLTARLRKRLRSGEQHKVCSDKRMTK